MEDKETPTDLKERLDTIKKIKKNRTPYIVNIHNNSTEKKVIKLFSMNELNSFVIIDNKNNHEDLEIDMVNSIFSYREFIEKISRKPFNVKLIEVISPSDKQLTNPIYLEKVDEDLNRISKSRLDTTSYFNKIANKTSLSNSILHPYKQDELAYLIVNAEPESIFSIVLYHDEEKTDGELKSPEEQMEQMEELFGRPLNEIKNPPEYIKKILRMGRDDSALN